MWQAGLAGWMQNAEPVGPMLQADMNTRKRKEDQDQIGMQRQQDYERQKEFAQHGIRWKVEDARRAGIHPLYALGGPGANYSPGGISVADGSGAPQVPQMDMAAMSQNISRAINSTRTGEEREMAQLQLASARADLDGRTLDNQMKASQLQKMNSTSPAFPGSQNFIDGQGNSGLIKNKQMERTVSMPSRPHEEPGATTSVGYLVNADGSLTPVPSSDAKEKIEDNLFHELGHALRNNVMPNITGGAPPPGYAWSFDHQAYLPKDSDQFMGKKWLKRINYYPKKAMDWWLDVGQKLSSRNRNSRMSTLRRESGRR